MQLSLRKKLALHLDTLSSITLMLKSIRKRPKRWWTHPLWARRKEQGAYSSLVKALRGEDPVYFKRYLRMTPDEFDQLRLLVSPYLTKHPAGRKALSVGHRLAITIRFLASGDSMASISFAFRIGFSTAHYVVQETCDALWRALKDEFLAVPSKESWQEIADRFWCRWQFPHCAGVVDGKHVTIQAPANSGTTFYNYKRHFSTVLMAVVDSNYKFIVVDIGGYGSNSDGGIWKNSEFGRAFEAGDVDFPADRALPNSTEIAPFVLLGDEGFQLRSNFLRPFPGKQLNDDRRIFNYRFSRARRCSENAFGILVARWRIFRRPINLKPENVDRVVKACIVLHNFFKTQSEKTNTSLYCPTSYADHIDTQGNIIEGDWRRDVGVKTAFGPIENTAVKNFSSDAFNVREIFVSYFRDIGSMPWQSELAGVNEFYLE